MTDEFDVSSKIQKLKHRISWIKKGLSIAERFVQNKSSELEKIDEEIELNANPEIEHDARKLSLDSEQSKELLQTIEKELDGLTDSLLNSDEEDDDGENDKIKNLRRYRRWLKRGLNFVGVFIQEKNLELKETFSRKYSPE